MSKEQDLEDAYIDGWTDGVAHRTNYTGPEHTAAIMKDWKESLTKDITDGLVKT